MARHRIGGEFLHGAMLATIPRSKLMTAATPSLEERRPSDQDFEQPGDLTAIAAIVPVRVCFSRWRAWQDKCPVDLDAQSRFAILTRR